MVCALGGGFGMTCHRMEQRDERNLHLRPTIIHYLKDSAMDGLQELVRKSKSTYTYTDSP